jgi:hypothetical protein
MLDHRAFGYTYPDLPTEDQVASRDADRAGAAAEVDVPSRVLASQAIKQPARLNQVVSAQLVLTSPAPGGNRSSEATVGGIAADDTISRANDILRQDGPPREPARDPARDPAPASAPHPAATLPDGRIFSVFESIHATRGDATTVNVFLNHPNPTPETSEDDPHFVGTFGLFGLQSHATHGGLSVEVELTETLTALRQAKRDLGGQFDVQVIPVQSQGDELELNLGRVNIITM